MLGVLKRRWKPKRATSGRRGVGTGRTGDSPVPTNEDNKQARVLPSPRQIHPVCEDKAQLIGYESKSVPPPPPPPHSLPLPPVPPPMPPTYPLTPNICVEGGRIEFIKTPPDVSTDQLPKQPPTPTPPPRLVQTATTQTGAELEQNELAKVNVLEARIQELERALELEQRNGQRERLALTRLQRQLARREVLQRDVDRERRLRLDTELRLRDSASEAERCRARLASLQREFTRMEETVRSMLQYKARSEQLKQEKNNLTVAYETRVLQFQNSITKLGQENETLRKQIRELEAAGAGEVQASLLERLHALENDNATLTRDAELQRRQYERCLDDVANQVVRALLSQKGLREEVVALQRRVKELESQNRALTSVLVQQLDPKHSEQAVTSVTPVSTPSSSGADLAGVWFPLQRPRSLNLQTHHHPHHHHHLHHQISAAIAPAAAAVVAAAAASGGTLQQPTRQAASQLIVAASGGEGAAARKAEDEGGSESPESGNRDEGYSTMSSDVQASERDPVPPLAGLQEASDETDTTITTTTASTTATALVPATTPTATHHLLVVEDACDPDVLYIPLGRLALGIGNPRHSFPPSRELLPYQHVMRSFSDSHLCLKLTAASPCTPSPCSLASTTSSSPSVLVLDVLADTAHPLRRTRATPSLAAAAAIADSDEDTTTAVEGCWWDTDYVQHWLRLDDTRSAMQRQLEYDQSELEDWTMSLSSEDIAPCTSTTTTTPGGLGPVMELEEDECVWGPGAGFLGSLLQDDGCRVWPATGLASPGGSWSSNSEDCCHSLDCCLQTMGATSSKRSSAALSDDADSCSPAALMSGTTDFTRDFYRLVKFESTKSLASSSSRSLACGEGNGISEREQALQSVLHFIAEQQQYCASRAEQDLQLPDQLTKELDEEHEETEEDKTEHIHEMIEVSTVDQSYPENEVISQNTSNRKIAREETLNEQNRKQDPSSCIVEEEIKQIPDKVKEEEEPEAEEEEEEEEDDDDMDMAVAAALYPGLGGLRPRVGEVLVTVIEEEDEEHAAAATTTSTMSSCSLEANRDMTESMTSTVSTPDTVVSRQANVNVNSFHERTSSKDVIEELNRMIRKGEEGGSQEAMGAGMGSGTSQAKLDLACCCPTGWVHVERDIDFTDPKARANLLDVMLASSGSSGGSTGSSGSGSSTGSNSSDSGDEPADYQHLHRLHRFRRQKKASATREQLGVLRYPAMVPRPSILGRDDFYVRYGDKEREAVASFDFLEDISTTSVSGASSCDTLLQPPGNSAARSQSQHLVSVGGLGSSEDSDIVVAAAERMSLSDSCAANSSPSNSDN